MVEDNKKETTMKEMVMSFSKMMEQARKAYQESKSNNLIPENMPENEFCMLYSLYKISMATLTLQSKMYSAFFKALGVPLEIYTYAVDKNGNMTNVDDLVEQKKKEPDDIITFNPGNDKVN